LLIGVKAQQLPLQQKNSFHHRMMSVYARIQISMPSTRSWYASQQHAQLKLVFSAAVGEGLKCWKVNSLRKFGNQAQKPSFTRKNGCSPVCFELIRNAWPWRKPSLNLSQKEKAKKPPKFDQYLRFRPFSLSHRPQASGIGLLWREQGCWGAECSGIFPGPRE
jgi:hypothetical protein